MPLRFRALACMLTVALVPLTALAARGDPAVAAQEPVSANADALRQIEALRADLASLREEVKALAAENRTLAQRLAGGSAPAAVVASAAPSAASAAPSPAPTSAAPVDAAASGVRLWGYGEIYYARPTRVPSRTQADLARAVFGLGYAFDERTEFNSEFEIEHAVSSAQDVGEFEVEQFYVDHRLTDSVALRAGLFLMPFGFLNEHHEPTHFYGVQRNFIETLVIPSTWREGGLNLHGDTVAGLSWNAGLTTGFDLSKWTFSSAQPPYSTALGLGYAGVAPLQASHQELALANARSLSSYLSVGYYGLPGLALGAAVSSGKAVPVPQPGAPNDPRVTLWEAHARYTPGPFELSALYAHGAIGGVGAVNAANPGADNPIPSAFWGYFAEAAYDAWDRDAYRFAPFVRFERYDLGASYAGTSGPVLPAGLVPLSFPTGESGRWPIGHDRVWTAGANFYVTPHVVFKADHQWFGVNRDFDRFDLGLGVAF